MGDGKVAMILDMAGLAGHAGISLQSEEKTGVSDRVEVEKTQAVLLFQAGRSEQYAISLHTVRRLERFACKNLEKVGDLEFLVVHGVSTRVIRMDSVLPVSPMEASEEAYLLLPKFAKQPVGFLISSLGDIVEAPINLDTNSFQADGILGTRILNDRLTLFPDIYRIIERAYATNREKPTAKSRGRILLAEDTPFFRGLVSNYLVEGGYRVTLAENGKQALELCLHDNFDLLISDLDMPEMDGFDLISALRKAGWKSPAIALTGIDSDTVRTKTLAAGFDRYEVKIGREDLLANVSQLLPSSLPV